MYPISTTTVAEMQMVHHVVYIYIYCLGNYNDLTATSLGMMVSKGNYPQMALIQAGEIL